jgi:hypothetical protein
VLADGESIFDALPDELTESLKAVAANRPDRCIPMTPDFWSGGLMNDVSVEEADRWLDRLVPSPEVWLSEPARLPTFATADVPTSYVFLEDDRAVPREVWEANAARLRDPRTTTSPGAHEAMLTRPRELAEALLRVCS